jgi:hypothetical protein
LQEHFDREGVSPEVFVLFDANVPHMYPCNKDCTTNLSFNCLHRFNKPTSVVYLNPKQHSYNDLRVSVTFYEWVMGQRINAEGKKFCMVTKDKDFIEDAEKEYFSAISKGAVLPQLHFDKSFPRGISTPIFNLRILNIKYNPPYKEELVRRIVEDVNNFTK